MAKPGVKERMPTLAAGNGIPGRTAGFTLLELLLVVTIVAIASAGVSLALRDSGQSRLEIEALRLSSILESARAQSRATGIPVRWKIAGTGFALDGAAGAWQHAGISASTDRTVLVLGPEPLIPAQSVRLWLTEQPQRSLLVSTDGLRPFKVDSANP
jgi:general secretion pathway protein H